MYQGRRDPRSHDRVKYWPRGAAGSYDASEQCTEHCIIFSLAFCVNPHDSIFCDRKMMCLPVLLVAAHLRSSFQDSRQMSYLWSSQRRTSELRCDCQCLSMVESANETFLEIRMSETSAFQESDRFFTPTQTQDPRTICEIRYYIRCES